MMHIANLQNLQHFANLLKIYTPSPRNKALKLSLKSSLPGMCLSQIHRGSLKNISYKSKIKYQEHKRSQEESTYFVSWIPYKLILLRFTIQFPLSLSFPSGSAVEICLKCRSGRRYKISISGSSQDTWEEEMATIQWYCLKSPMDRGPGWLQSMDMSWTWLGDLTHFSVKLNTRFA